MISPLFCAKKKRRKLGICEKLRRVGMCAVDIYEKTEMPPVRLAKIETVMEVGHYAHELH